MPVVWPWQRHRDHRLLRRPDKDISLGSPVRPGTDPTSPLSDEAFVAGLRPIPTGVLDSARRLPSLRMSGTSPGGRSVEVTLDAAGRTLVAFLAAHCDGCEAFWRGLGAHDGELLPPGLACVVVTRSAQAVEASQIGRLAADIRCPVVMSDEAWTQFQVMSYPVFVLVDGPSHSVVAETVAFSWDDVTKMVASAG